MPHSTMGSVRWFVVALSVLPLVWGFDAHDPSQSIMKWRLFRNPAIESDLSIYKGPEDPKVLEVFQVTEPILTEGGLTLQGASRPYVKDTLGGQMTASLCSKVLMNHSFANSYGAPFVGKYTPPSCDFDRVVLNFTTVVKGRQYDRTGVMYLGDTEVWRTSTAEPTASGIRWVWLQDMTPFLSLWKKPQTLIFDLGNLVNENYTGILNTTLEVTFFKSDLKSTPPADLIIPITQRLGSTEQPSQFITPEQNATSTVGFPRNANRAVLSVDVKAESAEEFWWGNVPQSDQLTFASTAGELPGYSPWREVRVMLDGRLAGVVWPFPVVYTGGIVPQLHRPIVGIDAFDIREHEIDVTPWLPLLCDGKEHTFTINVVGYDEGGKTPATLFPSTDNSWYVTGKIFVWLDDEGSVTTGTINSASQDPPVLFLSRRVTQNATGSNETLDYKMTVSREFMVSSHVKSQKREGTVMWKQSLNYTNKGYVYDYGNAASNDFSIVGADQGDSFSTRYSYPLYCNQTVNTTGGGLTLVGLLDQGLNYVTTGSPVFPTGLEAFGNKYDSAHLATWRNGTADYHRPPGSNRTSGTGRTEQVFSFGGSSAGSPVAELYHRRVSAFNDSVTMDREELLGKVFDHARSVPHLP